MRSTLAAAVTAVALAAVPAPAETYDVTSQCYWFLTNTPDSFDVLFVLVAVAEATGPTPAVETTVTCTASNAHGETVTASAPALGPRAVAASSRVMTLAPPQYCTSSTATWLYTENVVDLREHREAESEHCDPTAGQ